ncbi:MAG: hypothetical protein FWC91_07840 [Defluviitaleaceae bacterium]|nr:hypothetical protein [Defluviitaleaceae bacterium]
MAILTRSKEISALVDILPENEQNLAYEFIKRMVLAWDSDYTKLTPAERKRLEETDQDFITGNTVNHEDINRD